MGLQPAPIRVHAVCKFAVEKDAGDRPAGAVTCLRRGVAVVDGVTPC
jgi:hypothetical protein